MAGADRAERAAPRTPAEYEPVGRRTIGIAALAILIAITAACVAQALLALIGLVGNLAFHGRIDPELASPAGHKLGGAVILVPMAGALLVGLMARYGSAAIRGHGIPEVMERVLFGESRIPARVMFLKPASAAIAIGTGGPFGAEGPIIATGGALGSLVGQFAPVTADERKTLLAAGAAAGMAATFGTPVAAVLLAVELLLFEYRPRSLIPVSLAAAAATAIRLTFEGGAPIFAIRELSPPTGSALAAYAVIGAIMGALAAGVTRLAYGVEDFFERFGRRYRIHWMWWPLIGALVVGLVGFVEPRTLGVGYENITGALGGSIVGSTLLALVVLKLISWAVYLGSGTSGGTLAPLFTIGGGAGAWLGGGIAILLPGVGVDPGMAGLVGMAAIFAGASHALLASVVFAFETTRQPVGLLPLLAGCAAAYFVALLFHRHSIMTEKLARRGTAIRMEYATDHLAHVLVRDAMSRTVATLQASDTVASVLATLPYRSHQGFPVLEDDGTLVGVVTHRELLAAADDGSRPVRELVTRAPVVVYDDNSLREAADQMVLGHVGRLPVLGRGDPARLIGIVTRSDLLRAHAPRLHAASHRAPSVAARYWTP